MKIEQILSRCRPRLDSPNASAPPVSRDDTCYCAPTSNSRISRQFLYRMAPERPQRDVALSGIAVGCPCQTEWLPGVNASGLQSGSGDHALIALISVHWSSQLTITCMAMKWLPTLQCAGAALCSRSVKMRAATERAFTNNGNCFHKCSKGT